MRVVAFGVAIFFGAAIAADSVPGVAQNWSERLASLGLTSAHVVIEYSLTDDCEIGSVRALKASSRAVFDSQTIDGIVKTAIGPFETVNHELIASGQTSGNNSRPLSMNKRSFSWRTSVGHTQLVCLFYADGGLASATLKGSDRPAANSVRERPVAVRLSTLGTSTTKFTFKLGD